MSILEDREVKIDRILVRFRQLLDEQEWEMLLELVSLQHLSSFESGWQSCRKLLLNAVGEVPKEESK